PPPVTDLDIRLECAPGGPGGGEPPDTTAPAETLSGKRTQKLGRSVVVTVGCSEACTATGTGTVSVPPASKVYRLGRATKSLAAGRPAKLKLKLSKKAQRAAKRALKRHKRVRARVTVTVTDAAGNR